MLRITISDGSLEQVWIVQGRLVAPWAAELEKAWRSRSRREAQRWVVDLSEVTLIDRSGEKVLRAMGKAGARFIACGVYTEHVVQDIQKRCKPK